MRHIVSGFADREVVLTVRARIGPKSDELFTVTVASAASWHPATDPAATFSIGCSCVMSIEAPHDTTFLRPSSVAVLRSKVSALPHFITTCAHCRF
jgi:hypothetical protein